MDPGLLVAALSSEPERAAIFLDVDGVLAPIVARPEDARVPEETRRELERLRDRYALVGCVSGRMGADAARIVGVDGLVFAGEHGLELEPDAARWRDRVHAFADRVAWPDVERKRLTVSFHWRTADDPDAAELEFRRVALSAEAEGFVPRFGRKVLEIRPPVEANKGTAVTHLLAEHGLSRALYAGDDTTDLDAFRALADAALEVRVLVAVRSAEGPEELVQRADLVVDGPAAMLDVLRRL